MNQINYEKYKIELQQNGINYTYYSKLDPKQQRDEILSLYQENRDLGVMVWMVTLSDVLSEDPVYELKAEYLSYFLVRNIIDEFGVSEILGQMEKHPLLKELLFEKSMFVSDSFFYRLDEEYFDLFKEFLEIASNNKALRNRKNNDGFEELLNKYVFFTTGDDSEAGQNVLKVINSYLEGVSGFSRAYRDFRAYEADSQLSQDVKKSLYLECFARMKTEMINDREWRHVKEDGLRLCLIDLIRVSYAAGIQEWKEIIAIYDNHTYSSTCFEDILFRDIPNFIYYIYGADWTMNMFKKDKKLTARIFDQASYVPIAFLVGLYENYHAYIFKEYFIRAMNNHTFVVHFDGYSHLDLLRDLADATPATTEAYHMLMNAIKNLPNDLKAYLLDSITSVRKPRDVKYDCNANKEYFDENIDDMDDTDDEYERDDYEDFDDDEERDDWRERNVSNTFFDEDGEMYNYDGEIRDY